MRTHLAPLGLLTLALAGCSEDNGSSGNDTGTESDGSGTPTGSDTTTSGSSSASESTDSGGGTITGGPGTTGGTSSTGSSTGSGSSDSASMEPCQEETANIQPVPPRIMFVLDKSGSMYCFPWDHDGDGGTPEITRWESLYNVVETVLNTFESQIWFGAKLYPSAVAPVCTEDCNGCTDACVVDPVEVPVALDNAMTILDAIPAPDARVQGLTPMESGVQISLDYMRTLDAGLPRAQILVADGEISEETLPSPADCPGEFFADTEALVEDAWQNDGIATYVVGITDVAEQQLDVLAQAGGKPRPGGPPYHYQTDDQTELEQAMVDIINDQLGCTIAIDPEPEEPQLFQVWIGGTRVPEVTDCATEDGWVWVSAPPYTSIEVCGTACGDLKAAGSADTKYFCEPG